MSTEFTSPVCPNPIFIIGSPRSGSTILAWSLAQHEELWTSGETHFLWRLFGASDHLDTVFRNVKDWPGGSWLSEQNVEHDEFLRYLGEGINALFTSRCGQRRWIDQTPYYVYMARQLRAMFPGARFLHIMRDGRKVVHSMTNFSNALADGVWSELVASGRLQGWATDFRQACREWHRSVEAALSFASQYPEICLPVANEKLVSDPDQTFSEIFDFLGVPRRPEPAQYLRSNRINSSFPTNSAPSPQSCQPADPWCGWDQERRDIFIQEAGDTLLRCGMVAESELNLSDHQQAIFRLREEAQQVLPRSAFILVVTGGDDELLNVGGRQSWHFPRTKEGWHAGHSADSQEAIAHLEESRRQGAQFLVIPSTSMWWLDYYADFHRHLQEHYATVLKADECTIFKLTARINAPVSVSSP